MISKKLFVFSLSLSLECSFYLTRCTCFYFTQQHISLSFSAKNHLFDSEYIYIETNGCRHCVHQSSGCRRHRLEKKRKRERERVFYISSRTQYDLDSRAMYFTRTRRRRRKEKRTNDRVEIRTTFLFTASTHARTRTHTRWKWRKKPTVSPSSSPSIYTIALSLVRF